MKLCFPGFSIFFDRFQSCSKTLKHVETLLPPSASAQSAVALSLILSLCWRQAAPSRGDANLQTTPLPTFHDIPKHSHYIHLYPLYSLAYFHSTTCFLGLSALWMALLCRRCLCLTRWIVVRFCWFESGMTCWFLANVRFHVPPASHRQTFGGSAAAAGAASVLGVPGVDEPGTKPKEVKLWTLKLCNCVKVKLTLSRLLSYFILILNLFLPQWFHRFQKKHFVNVPVTSVAYWRWPQRLSPGSELAAHKP